jgi:hypothetical protein
MIAGTALAQADDEVKCPRGNGRGLGIGAPGNGKGQGQENGWPHRCKDRDDNGGADPGGATPGGGNPGGGNPGGGGGDGGGSSTAEDGSGIDVSVVVNVELPDAMGTAMPVAESTRELVQSIAEQTLGVIGDAATHVRNDVANTLEITDLVGDGVTGTVGGGVTVAGTTVGGSVGLGGNIGSVNSMLSGMLSAF